MAGAGESKLKAIRTGLLGGSFNPAHRAHRRISLAAMAQLRLDETWWLVSPENPLKTGTNDMAPLPARLASARRVVRRSPIRASALEAKLGTRYTVDTVRKLIRLYPNRRFVWVMGADIVAEMHRWRNWRALARSIVIAVAVRPGYAGLTAASPAAAWLRRFVRPAGGQDWTRWRPPALVLLHLPPDPISATAIRRADPDWHLHIPIPISAQPPDPGGAIR